MHEHTFQPSESFCQELRELLPKKRGERAPEVAAFERPWLARAMRSGGGDAVGRVARASERVITGDDHPLPKRREKLFRFVRMVRHSDETVQFVRITLQVVELILIEAIENVFSIVLPIEAPDQINPTAGIFGKPVTKRPSASGD